MNIQIMKIDLGTSWLFLESVREGNGKQIRFKAKESGLWDIVSKRTIRHESHRLNPSSNPD